MASFSLKNDWIYQTTQSHGTRGSVVIKALSYKPEECGFESRWGERMFSMYLILPAALGPGVYSACNREYQKQKNSVSGEQSAASS
jgi:hypothetical protein